MDGYLSVSIFSDDEESAVEELLEENTSSARSVVTLEPVNRNAEADSELINATDTPLRPRDFIKVGPTRKCITHRLLNSSSGENSESGSKMLPKGGEFKEIKYILKLLCKKVEKNSRVLTELQFMQHSRLV